MGPDPYDRSEPPAVVARVLRSGALEVGPSSFVFAQPRRDVRPNCTHMSVSPFNVPARRSFRRSIRVDRGYLGILLASSRPWQHWKIGALPLNEVSFANNCAVECQGPSAPIHDNPRQPRPRSRCTTRGYSSTALPTGVHCTGQGESSEFALSRHNRRYSGRPAPRLAKLTELDIPVQNIANPRPILHEDTVYCPPDGCASLLDEGRTV